MSADVVCVDASASLVETWTLLTRHQAKALPVIDAGRLAGILSLHDLFVSRARPHKLDASPVFSADSRVRDLMSASVTTAGPEQAVIELLPLFAEQGLHHVPVVDAGRRVLGMLSHFRAHRRAVSHAHRGGALEAPAGRRLSCAGRLIHGARRRSGRAGRRGVLGRTRTPRRSPPRSRKTAG